MRLFAPRPGIWNAVKRLPPIVILPLLAAFVIANPIALLQGSVQGPYPTDGAEYQAQVSIRNGTGSLTQQTKHILQSTIAFGTYGQVTTGSTGNNVRTTGSTAGPNISTATTSTGTTSTGSTSTGSTSTSTGSTSTSTGSTGLNLVLVTGQDSYMQATNPTEAPNPVAVANVIINSGGSTVPGLTLFRGRQVLTNPSNVVFPTPQTQNGYSQGALQANLAAVGTISGGAMTLVQTLVPWTELWNVGSGASGNVYTLYSRTVNSQVQQELRNLTISELLALDAAIDTRKTYGVPNDAGVLPGADPNASPAYLNFTPWIYQGGLFVGQAPWLANDGSGTSRVQLWPQGVTSGMSSSFYSTLSAFYLGTTTAYNGNMTVGVYTPSTTDSDLSYTESTVSWPTRWTSLDPTNNPSALASYAFTSTSTLNDYYNFHLGANQPLSALTYLCLENTQEQSFQQNGTLGWRYFASRWYGGSVPGATYPITDSAPRLWVVTANGSPSTWMISNSLFGAQ